MISRSRKLIYYSVAAIFLLVIISGCAQSRSAIKDDVAVAGGGDSVAVIKAINVSSDASQVEIQTDKPLSYTYYKTTEPPKIVIDIAQTLPGAVANTLEVNAGNIKRIEVAKHEFTGGFLSRIEIIPLKDLGDFSVATDPVDKGKMSISFVKAQGEGKSGTEAKIDSQPAAVPGNEIKANETQPQTATAVTKEEAKPLPAVDASASTLAQTAQAPPAAVSETKQETKPVVVSSNVLASQPKVVSAVTVGDDSIEITVAGGVDVFSEFKLTKPDRIVLDIPETKNGITAKAIAINKFGISKARLGSSTGKVRIVLDAEKGSLSSYKVAKSENGLKVIFAGTPEKAAGKDGKEPAVEAAISPVDAKASVAPDPAPSTSKMLSAVAVNDEGIDLTINGGIDTFNSFKLTKPDRIVVDLTGVKSSMAAKPVVINKFGVGKARLGNYPDKTRVVLDAAKDVIPPHQLIKEANGLKVLFAGASAKTEVKEGKEPVKDAAGSSLETNKEIKSGASAVEAIDFSIAGEYSQVALKLGGNCNVGNIAHVANGLSLTIHNCQVPKKFQRTIDTSAFPSVVQKIIPYQVKVKKGNEARVLVKLRQKVSDTFLKPEGNTILWSIKNPEMTKMSQAAPKQARGAAYDEESPAIPVSSHRERAVQGAESDVAQISQQAAAYRPGDKKVYTGRRVSLEFSDADIRKILQLIAEVSNLNFLIGADVTGTLSIKLVNVPWDQALDVILDTTGLEKRQDGNIMYIKPKGKFKSEEQEESEAKKEYERRMELKTRVFEVSFASVDDIARQFEKLKSDRGIISQDGRTNRVIVKDIEDRIEEMARLLKTLDQPEKQVMIEARIVEATTTFSEAIGVQWGLHYRDPSATFLGMRQVDVGLGGIITPPPTSGTFVDTNPSTTGGAAGISFGKLTSNIQVDLRLSAAASMGQIKVISTPKVLTLNNKAAKITQGQSIPYQTTSAEGTKTEFVEAALTLEVTPHVANDGSVSMKIKASNNSAGASIGNAPPPINKKEATTEVQVTNGETIVIGGIYQDSDTEANDGVPFLMDIPWLGWLFKSNTKGKTKTELLIFITPKIVS